jgi:hypothetical protein
LEHDGENRRHGTPDGYRTKTISMIGRESGRGQSLPVRKIYHGIRRFAVLFRMLPKVVPREGFIRNHRHDEPLLVLSMVA